MGSPKKKRVRVLGGYWTLVFEPLFRYRTQDGKRVDGLCDPPHVRGRKIHIDSSLEGKNKFETCIHEFTHAADPTKSEEWVEEFALDLTNFLWDIGYREVEKRGTN